MRAPWRYSARSAARLLVALFFVGGLTAALALGVNLDHRPSGELEGTTAATPYSGGTGGEEDLLAQASPGPGLPADAETAASPMNETGAPPDLVTSPSLAPGSSSPLPPDAITGPSPAPAPDAPPDLVTSPSPAPAPDAPPDLVTSPSPAPAPDAPPDLVTSPSPAPAPEPPPDSVTQPSPAPEPDDPAKPPKPDEADEEDEEDEYEDSLVWPPLPGNALALMLGGAVLLSLLKKT
ncbi:MAG: hypothetical protein ACYC55_01635 [Candidatus Geothermincolia bacterium]